MGPSTPRLLAPPAVPRARTAALLVPAPRLVLRRRSKSAVAATAVAAAAVSTTAVAVGEQHRTFKSWPWPLHALPAPLVDALAGGLACGAMDVMYIADVLKVRAQSGVPLLRGGVRALFAGAGPSALFRVAHGVCYLPLYCAVKHHLQDKAEVAEALAVASAAVAAVTATALVELPLEAVMLRVKAGGTASFAAAARAALASPAGIAGLWAGAAPYVLRHAVYEAAEFVVYEHLRTRELRRRAAAPDTAHGGGLDARMAASLAAAAGAAATLVSHPLDCVRVATSLGPGGQSARAAAAHIMRTAGPAGFARGLAPRLASTVPGAAIFFTVYEAARARLGAPDHDGAHGATRCSHAAVSAPKDDASPPAVMPALAS